MSEPVEDARSRALAGERDGFDLDGEVPSSTLAAAGHAWMVAEGHVELDLELAGARDSRTLLCHVPAGGLLAELPPQQQLPADVTLVVHGRARLVAAPPESLRADLAAPLAAWVDGLAAAVAAVVDPRPLHSQVDVSAGEERNLLLGDSVSPRDGLVWARVSEGAFRVLGRNELLVGSRGLVPLTHVLWGAAVTPEVRVRLLATSAPPSADEVREATSWLLRGAVAITAASARRRLAADRARVAARSELDGRVLDGTLRRLSRIAGGRNRGVAAESLIDGPLLAAGREVADRLGLRLRAPVGGLPENAGRESVAAVARVSKVRTRKVRLRGDWWRRDNGPLLAFRAEDGAPVALLLASPSSYRLVDPARPDRSGRVDAATAASLHPAAFMFYPSFGDRALTLAAMFRIGMRGLGRDVGLLLGAALAVSLAGLVAPISAQILFDEIIPRADRGLLPVMALFLVVVPLSSALVGLVQSRAMLRLQGRTEMNVETALMDRVLRLPASFFKRFLAGDLETRLTAVSRLRTSLSGTVLGSVLSGIFSLTSLGLVLAYDPKLALLGLGLGLVSLAVIVASSLLGVRYNRQLLEINGELQGLVLQLLSGISKLRVAAAERRAFAVWGERFARHAELKYRFGEIRNHFALFQRSFPLLTSMAMFWAVHQIGAGAGAESGATAGAGAGLSSGSFVAVLTAFGQFLNGLLGLGSSVISVINVVPDLERVRPLLDALPEDRQEMVDPGRLRGEVEVTGLVFRYEDGPVVLNDVSLSARSGEMVAIVGPSGSGKSTLARLLLGLEKPEAGTIYYDGEDLQSLDPSAVRAQIGTVLQGGVDLGGSLEEALLGGANDLATEDAWEAARLAALDDEIRALPMGMSTVLSENWTTFSGGQQQRIRLARALVRKPRVLILDEATSAVDNRSQETIRDNLDGLGTTRIVIAHRLSTIRQANRIYMLEAGRITESGSFEELMARGGRFALMAGRQQL